MSTSEGRRFIWRQLEVAGVFSACYSPEAEGGRRVGLLLLGDLVGECQQEYLTMQSEQMAQSHRENVAKESKKEEKEDEEDYAD